MSDIQVIIELIEEGSSNSDHRDGHRQINEAVAILRRMQEDGNLNAGTRWEIAQVLGCGTLGKDIKAAVKELKEAQGKCWLPMDSAPKSGAVDLYYRKMKRVPNCFWSEISEAWETKIWDGTSRVVTAAEEPIGWMLPPEPPLLNADHLAET